MDGSRCLDSIRQRARCPVLSTGTSVLWKKPSHRVFFTSLFSILLGFTIKYYFCYFRDLSTENLSFLSSEQALADLANFIVSMNEKYNFDMASIKWIAFGGSYPGSLAAWLREKYPHLVHGSVSSSGPLLAKADFREYYEVVTASLASYSQKCVDAIQKGTEQVELLLLHMVGQRNINEKFMYADKNMPN